MPKPEQEPSISKDTYIICACSEGKERSRSATTYLSQLGYYKSKLLPCGLIGLNNYILSNDTVADVAAESRIKRGEKPTLVFADCSSEYNKLLHLRSVVWLAFIGPTEWQNFRPLINRLSSHYRIDVHLRTSHHHQDVIDQINQLLAPKE